MLIIMSNKKLKSIFFASVYLSKYVGNNLHKIVKYWKEILQKYYKIITNSIDI